MTTTVPMDGQAIADVLPRLMGFMPTDSIVVVGINLDTGRTGPIARFDFGLTNMSGVANALKGNGAIVLSIGDSTGEALVDAVSRLTRSGVLVIERFALDNPVNALTRDFVTDTWQARVENHADPLTEDEVNQLIEALPNVPDLSTTAARWKDIAVTSTDDANRYFVAALAMYLAGNGAEALTGFERALEINPNHVLSPMLLAMLEAGTHPERVMEAVVAYSTRA